MNHLEQQFFFFFYKDMFAIFRKHVLWVQRDRAQQTAMGRLEMLVLAVYVQRVLGMHVEQEKPERATHEPREPGLEQLEQLEWCAYGREEFSQQQH